VWVSSEAGDDRAMPLREVEIVLGFLL